MKTPSLVVLVGAVVAAVALVPAEEPMKKTRFQRVDANGDGRIEADEYAAFCASQAGAMDANRDGVISEDEAKAQARAEVDRDPDHDGPATVLEYLGQPCAAKADPTLGLDAIRFDAMDADRDGRIGIEEFLVHGAAWFAAADADQDGRLTADELAAAYLAILKRAHRAAGDSKTTVAEWVRFFVPGVGPAPGPVPAALPREEELATEDLQVRVRAPGGADWEFERFVDAKGEAPVALVKARRKDRTQFFFLMAKVYTVPQNQVLPAEEVMMRAYRKNYEKLFTDIRYETSGPVEFRGYEGHETQITMRHAKIGEIKKLERIVADGRNVFLVSAEGKPEVWPEMTGVVERWFATVEFKALPPR